MLCRNNPEAMRVSEFLFEEGIDNRLQRGAADRSLPGWLTDLFLGETRSSWSRLRLLALVEQRSSDGIELPEPEVVWELLTAVVNDDERIDIGILTRRLGLRPGY